MWFDDTPTGYLYSEQQLVDALNDNNSTRINR